MIKVGKGLGLDISELESRIDSTPRGVTDVVLGSRVQKTKSILRVDIRSATLRPLTVDELGWISASFSTLSVALGYT